MANVQTNRPFRAYVPEGCEAHLPNLHMVPVMAWGAFRHYHGRTLTEDQWGALLRRIRYAPARIVATKGRLRTLYTVPLSFDEWADLFQQLATEHVHATKYPHLR